MKKLIFMGVALVALTLGACKKNYTCDCKKSRTSGGTTVTTDDGTYTFDDTRTRAETRCNDQEGSGSDAFGDYSRNCTIQ